MHALITGVAGQDGTLLSDQLLARGWEVTGSKLATELLSRDHPMNFGSVVELDVIDSLAVSRLLAQKNPDVIFHLAGITSVAFSIKQPELTHQVNVEGTQNFLNALRDLNLFKTHFIHAASTEIYDAESGVITENSELLPKSPYASSKAEAFRNCVAARELGLRVTNAALANHESKFRSTDFVTGKIAAGVAQISLGLNDHISLGNLDVEKDWSSAADIIDGLIAIAEQEFIGDIILASGRSVTLSDFISEAFMAVGISNWQFYVSTDPGFVRLGETKKTQIDPAKARNVLNWHAITPLKAWVAEMVDHHIQKLSASN